MIPGTLLHKYNAALVPYDKGAFLFREGDKAEFFHVVHSGTIKMMNYSEEGREFIQGYFTEGQSFGEPPFFTESDYPAIAQAVIPSAVWKLSRSSFLQLLKENFDVQIEIIRTLSSRLIYKSTMLTEFAIEEAEHRLRTLLRYLATTLDPSGKSVRIPFTRRQLADMTGLRVETTIRTIKALEQKGVLVIDDDGKILLIL